MTICGVLFQSKNAILQREERQIILPLFTFFSASAARSSLSLAASAQASTSSTHLMRPGNLESKYGAYSLIERANMSRWAMVLRDAMRSSR